MRMTERGEGWGWHAPPHALHVLGRIQIIIVIIIIIIYSEQDGTHPRTLSTYSAECARRRTCRVWHINTRARARARARTHTHTCKHKLLTHALTPAMYGAQVRVRVRVCVRARVRACVWWWWWW